MLNKRRETGLKACLIFMDILLLFLMFVGKCSTREAILLDTRTALSDLGWVKSQGSMWEEMSSSDAEGNERRMFMVCEITKDEQQNNWLRTQFIPVQGARRVFVEVEFAIRSCDDVANVASCKETFNLYYYETDRDEATSTFPPWEEGAYKKIDTIAADQRFSPGSMETNFETRDIGPITKNGMYLAIQDAGACVALMHIRVYYKYCDEATQNLANFARTTAGPEMISLVETKGSCVRNAVIEHQSRPSLYCNGEGSWTVPSGSCVCGAGFEPNHDLTQCRPCNARKYKSKAANQPCTRCPDYSRSPFQGATICDCMSGYFRSYSDSANQPCSKPPTKPINLYSKLNKTSVLLTWQQPYNTGGRDDLSYSVECMECKSGFVGCKRCNGQEHYFPTQKDLTMQTVTVSSLHSYRYYKLKVCAVNGVSNVAKASGKLQDNCAEARVETNQAAPSAVAGVRLFEVSDDTLVIAWDEPISTNGPIQEYEVVVTSVTSSGDPLADNNVKTNRTTERRMTVTELRHSTQYRVKVRARTSAGYGPFSEPIRVKTKESDFVPTISNDSEATESGGPDMQIILGACAGVIFLLLLIAITVFCLRRRSKKRRIKKRNLEKLSTIYNGPSVHFSRSYGFGHKTYIDPTTYEDPNMAVREFTKEIEMANVKIEQVIGGGEFGEVCRGKLFLPGEKARSVAIKTLKIGYSTQQKMDFLGEASIMGQFDHPNVIRLEGVVTRGRPLMIVTEYMENGSLDAHLRNHDNEFTVIQLVGMLRNIASGMKYLSEMGYVHRDLAARNILVNDKLICKVSDFGMSRVLEDDTDPAYTTTGGKIPIRWTAPEAFTFSKFTSASDVWSYGIVMWEVMSYGERPYWGMSNRDVMNAVETGYRLPAPMDCPQVQHKLMLDCWKKDRNQRPKFGQIVASLDHMLGDPTQLKTKVTEERTGPSNGTIPVRLDSAVPLAAGKCHTMFARIPAAPVTITNADSGINEDTDEESAPMLKGRLLDAKSVNSSPPRDMSCLESWLDGIGLPEYKDKFMRNGYTSIEQVMRLNSSDLTRLGMIDENDQERLMNCLQEIPPQSDHPLKSVTLPTYAESNLMHAGITV